MSKSIQSFYDWELGFKKKNHEVPSQITQEEVTKPLGIPKSEFESFLTTWKKKNLS